MSGGLIGKPNIPTAISASGVWGLRSQLRARRDEIWPIPITTATFISSVEDLTNTTSPTFSNYDTSSFLTTDRMVIVVAGDLTGAQVTGVTVGGQPCDQDLSPTATGSGFAGIYSKSNVSGNTSNIIATVSGTVNRAAIGVFRLRNSNGSVPTLKFSDFSLLAATSGTGGTDTLNMPAGSVGILVASYGNAGTRVTWNGITTEHVDKDFATEGSAAYSIASINAETTNRSAQSITTSHASTTEGYTVLGCSYG